MKKLWFVFISLIVMLLAACSGNGDNSGESSGGDTQLRASSGVPTSHYWHRAFFEPLVETVETETDGEVGISLFTSGELVELGGEYDALRQGNIDIAMTLMAPYDPQRFPYTEVVMLPLLESDARIASEAMKRMMESDREIADGKTYYELEFGDKGLVAFPTPATEPYVISTTGHKFEEVSDFDKSIRMRTASRVHEVLADTLGISAISMPISEAYDALSRNALDGFFYNLPDWISFGFDELMRETIVGANLGHFIGHTAMKEETWESLSPEAQEVFINATEELMYEGAELNKSESELNEEANKEKGGNFTHLDDLNPEVANKIKEAMVESWMDWIDHMEGQGYAGKEMALLWRDMLVESGGVLPDEIMALE